MPRPRTPTAVKRLQGVPPSRINDTEPVPPQTGVPKPPRGMSTFGRKLWTALAKPLHDTGLLTGWDVAAFTMLIDAADTHHQAMKVVRIEGPVKSTPQGSVAHPAFKTADQAAKTFRLFAAEFGLTPATRAGLSIPIPDDADDEVRRLLAR